MRHLGPEARGQKSELPDPVHDLLRQATITASHVSAEALEISGQRVQRLVEFQPPESGAAY